MKLKTLSIEDYRNDFPIFRRLLKDKNLIYLDSAATSQKPKEVIEAVKNFYSNYNANVHRVLYDIGEEATLAYENAHSIVGNFINAKFEEIVFTRGTTESLNLVAYSLIEDLNKNDEILLTEMEHHSNLVPWQQIGKRNNVKVKFAKITKDGKLDMKDFENKLNKKTKIVSVTHVSNVLGTINDIKGISKIVHENKSILVVDGAQAVPHMKVDVKNLGVDFYAFSGHKMLAPMGIGVLYGKEGILKGMKPFNYGGDMIKEVKLNDTKFNDLPWKFEAGTPNVAGAIGLMEAIKYLKKIGMENVENHEKILTNYCIKNLENNKDIEIYGPKERNGLVSFNIGKIHSHDVSTILNEFGVAIRAGHHCCMPLMKVLGISGCARASFHIYNNKEDIDVMIKGLGKVRSVFK